MRVLFVALLLALPLSGCVGDIRPLTHGSVFAFAPVVRGDAAPQALPTCAALLTELRARALDQARVALEQSVEQRGYYGVADGDVAMAASSEGGSRSAAPAPASARGAQVTGTNNQEAAADESDLVKTDGEWTYVLSQGVLHFLHSENVGDIEEVGRMEFSGSWGGELLLERRDPDDPDDDRLVVILPGEGVQGKAVHGVSGAAEQRIAWGMTHVLVLSLRDREAPVVERETWIEGQSVGGRLVDGHAYVVVHRWEQDLGLQTWAYPDEEDLRERGLTQKRYYSLGPAAQASVRREIAEEADDANRLKLANTTLYDHLPIVLRPFGGALTRSPIDERACKRVLTTSDSTGRGFTTILAIALDSNALATTTTQVTGANPIVYASEDALVLAAPSQDLWWFWVQPNLEEATDLQWFDLDGLTVRPRASGRVPGIVQDSFGIDVEGDELRVATTTGTWGRWWMEDPAPMMNHVAVFEAVGGKLAPRGIVGGIAPGERIWSARFTEDRAYLVTFRQMDPLWVIDLSGAPKVLGELEIPGVSTYIHPLDEDALLTIGLGPGPDGQGLDWSRLQVSLFDISNPQKPRRADAVYVTPAGGYSWSGALHEHKAFTYWPAVGTLAVPVATHREYQTVRGGVRQSAYDLHVGLRLVDVDRARLDLSLRGEVDQDDLVPDGENWGAEVQRSYFLGYPRTGPVSVYAISMLGITAHDLETLQAQDAVAFDAR